MLRLAIVFLLVAILAGILGIYPVANISVEFARIAFFLFLVLFLVSLMFGVARGNPPPV
jgi:uncharacterized membrane protein YtjA (UPF0391 family)